jgi:hypothetical protein
MSRDTQAECRLFATSFSKAGMNISYFGIKIGTFPHSKRAVERDNFSSVQTSRLQRRTGMSTVKVKNTTEIKEKAYSKDAYSNL